MLNNHSLARSSIQTMLHLCFSQKSVQKYCFFMEPANFSTKKAKKLLFSNLKWEGANHIAIDEEIGRIKALCHIFR